MRIANLILLAAVTAGCAPTGSDAPEPEQTQTSPVVLESPEATESPAPTDFSDAPFVYSASVTGTDFDIITASDPTSFCTLEFTGRSQQEMPDKTSDGELFAEAFTFQANFNHGPSIAFAMDIDFASTAAAEADALRYASRLGKLPFVLREGVNRLVVHKGSPDTTAFSDIGLIVLYSANADRRIQTNDLEETLLHESVHATWDVPHATSANWQNAQREDNAFVTNYAKSLPELEDLAESVLFAYALIAYPDRLPPSDAEAINRAIPARINIIRDLFSTGPQAPADARCPNG